MCWPPLSALLGLLILIVTIIMAIASYLRDINMTVSGFGHMASSVEASLIHEMVKVNERQLAVLEGSLDKEKIARGEPADSPHLGYCPSDQARQPLHLLLQPESGSHRQLPGVARAPRL